MTFEPVSALLDIGGKLIDRLWPDPEKKAAAQLELLKMQQAGELAAIAGQLEINKVEAGNPTLFVSGWRPAVGWVCVAGLAVEYVAGPLATWIATLIGHPIAVPKLDLGSLMVLLTGMLGLSATRMVEKIQGVAAK